MKMTKLHQKQKNTLILLGILMIIIALIGTNTGKMGVTPQEVWQTFLGKGTKQQEMIIYDFRLPRIFLATLVGIGMGVSGSLMQSLLKNDMASPGTLGISSGSGLFVLVYIAWFSNDSGLSPYAIPLLAFIGGLISAVFIFLLAFKKGKLCSPTNLILTGVAVGSGYSALSMFITLRLEDRQMDFMQKWQAGNLWGDDWRYIKILFPIIIILLIWTLYKAKVLNVIHLGDETAIGLGVSVKQEFFKLSLSAIALSSASVALGGNFFFVGLIAPHMARKLVGSNHRIYLPAAAMLGGLIILVADTLTHMISFGSDMPTGLVITIISTPYFLYLLTKTD